KRKRKRKRKRKSTRNGNTPFLFTRILTSRIFPVIPHHQTIIFKRNRTWNIFSCLSLLFSIPFASFLSPLFSIPFFFLISFSSIPLFPFLFTFLHTRTELCGFSRKRYFR